MKSLLLQVNILIVSNWRYDAVLKSAINLQLTLKGFWNKYIYVSLSGWFMAVSGL